MKKFFSSLGTFIGKVAALVIFMSVVGIIGVLALKIMWWIWIL